MDILGQLENIVGSNYVLNSAQASERSMGIWTRNESLNVKGLVMPKSTEEVAAIMSICYNENQRVVPHGGLTNLIFDTQAGPDDLILSLERLNVIEEIDTKSRVAIVQSGVILQSLQEVLREHGLLYPVDFGARGSAMIGGSIATNAGGIQVLRYGTTRTQVLGLEVVLSDGRIISSLNKMIKDKYHGSMLFKLTIMRDLLRTI